MRRSRLSQGYGRLGGCVGSAWEETKVNSTERGGSYGGLKFSSKNGTQVFVVECEECGRFLDAILGGSGRWLLGECDGKVWGF